MLLPASWTAGLLTAHLITTSFLIHFVPEAYMVSPNRTEIAIIVFAFNYRGTAVLVWTERFNVQDEPFHVPMTQRYCQGDFLYWDPKVTTFPGLYIIGLLYAKLSGLLLIFMPGPKV